MELAHQIESLAGGSDRGDLCSTAPEDVTHQLARVCFIVYHQNAHPIQSPITVLRQRARCRFTSRKPARISKRDAHAESRAFIFAATLGRHRSAVELNQVANDRQPKSKPAMPAGAAGILLAKPIEYVWQKLGFDSLSRIADDNLSLISGGLQKQLHLAAFRRELDRVRKQIPDYLLQPIGIAQHRRRMRIEDGNQPNALSF